VAQFGNFGPIRDCRIPAENVLLGPGAFKKQMAGFNVGRLGNTARAGSSLALATLGKCWPGEGPLPYPSIGSANA
jgi:hypothetical protein